MNERSESGLRDEMKEKENGEKENNFRNNKF